MIDTVLLIVAGTLATLVTGVFFGFAVAVNPGLRRVPDVDYLRVMQSINVVIVNPFFLTAFLGAPVLLPIAALVHEGTQRWLLLAAAVVQIVGSFGVTVTRSIPLNKKLEAVDLAALDPAGAAALRAAFERPWVRWHTVRTVAGVVVTALVLAGAAA